MRVVGLPLTTASMTDEFRSLLASSARLALISTVALDLADRERSNDYVCARAGYDYLIDSGFDFVYPDKIERGNSYRLVVMLPVWYDADGSRRSPCDVAADVIALAATLRDKGIDEVGYLTQGSPRLYDSISSRLIDAGATVVDTASSADLAYAAIADASTLPRRDIDPRVDLLVPGYANVVGCVGPIYGGVSQIEPIVSGLARASRAWVVGVSDRPDVLSVSPTDLAAAIRAGAPSLNSKTLILEMEAA